jgi:hypothetical protein
MTTDTQTTTPNSVSKRTLTAKGTKPSAPPAPTIKTGKYASTDIITVLVANPKKPGCKGWHRWNASYASGKTVAQFIADGGLVADLDWDIRHKFIKVEKAAG